MRMDNEQTTRRAFDERGWVRVTEFDSAERRAVWMRDLCSEDGSPLGVEFCAGREGDDHYLYIDSDEWVALDEGRPESMHPKVLGKLVWKLLHFWEIAYDNAQSKQQEAQEVSHVE